MRPPKTFKSEPVKKQSKSDITKEAREHLTAGQIDKAISVWTRFVEYAPEGSAYNIIGDLHLKNGDKKAAKDYFHKTANYFKREGFPEKAIAVYKKILTFNQDVYTLVILAEIYENKGLTAPSVACYLNAIELLILIPTTDKDYLLKTCEKVLLLEPFNITMRDKITKIFIEKNLMEYAVREYMYAARFYLDKKDGDTAKSYFQKALILQPDNQSARAGLEYFADSAVNSPSTGDSC